ncbi:hypothetical protein EVJ58_g8847 [Rhodofomes roseus]|uniref:C3H1-type domain-containing protein n=1 Tax=Rhodofomes roseus TaxID=34475 RepID=A0A4Y9XWF7_9APHY|nr:hypothetical protein EVJ58_g8847 [Rhodofomes roseus]
MEGQYFSAVEVAEQCQEKADPSRLASLWAHHRLMRTLAVSWDIWLEYDITQRETSAFDGRVDIGSLHNSVLNLIVARCADDAWKALVRSSPAAPGPSYATKHAMKDFPLTFAPPLKKFRSDSSATGPGLCFWCGIPPAHLPHACSATTTAAGIPCAALSSSGGPNALTAPDGKQYCFSWAKAGQCSYSSCCHNSHSHSPSATAPPTAPEPARRGPDPHRVVTPLMADVIEDILHCHHLLEEWQPVLTGIHEGFCTGAETHLAQTVISKNHASCDLDPTFIDRYITAEQTDGRYSRAFEPRELEEIIGPFRTSPLGLVPKPGTSTYRMIQDLSYPRNDPSLPSVNAAINSDDFPTAWGTFAKTSEPILTLPPGCQAATFDILAAYHITAIHPSQQHMLCMYWCGKVYIDFAAAFGMASSAGIFGSIAELLGSGPCLAIRSLQFEISEQAGNMSSTVTSVILPPQLQTFNLTYLPLWILTCACLDNPTIPLHDLHND